jgi:hypothetical protein
MAIKNFDIQRKEELERKETEKQEKKAEQLKKAEQIKEKKEQDRRIINSYNRGKQIKQVMILNTVNDSKKSFTSSVVRGTVGSVLGPVEAVGGALSGKNKITSKKTFLIEYMNGNKITKTVDTNSKEYKELCKYIIM